MADITMIRNPLEPPLKTTAVASLPWRMARVSTKSNYHSGPISKDSKLRVRNGTGGISYMHQFEANVK